MKKYWYAMAAFAAGMACMYAIGFLTRAEASPEKRTDFVYAEGLYWRAFPPSLSSHDFTVASWRTAKDLIQTQPNKTQDWVVRLRSFPPDDHDLVSIYLPKSGK